MEIVDKKPVPIYEAECDECHSRVRYKKSELRLGNVITCPVCGMSIWTVSLTPVEMVEMLEAATNEKR